VLSATVFYLSIAPAKAQELTDDERQQLAQEGAADGKNTALKDVQLLKPFGNFGSMENAAKRHIPSSVNYIYSTAFDEAYKKTYYTEGQKIAGPLPEQHTMGDVDEVNALIGSHLKPTDDFAFQSASQFELTTLHGKPVWKIDQYSVTMTGYDSPTFTVIVENGKIRFVSGPSFSATVSFPSN